MEIIAGVITAVAIVALGSATHQGRSLSFYSTVLVVIALVYVLFAVMAEAPRTVMIESAIAAVFVVVAVAAARWENRHAAGILVAAGLAAHGVYDLVHSAIVSNPVVPAWWPVFCGVVDVVLGGWVVFLVRRNRDGASSGAFFRFPR